MTTSLPDGCRATVGCFVCIFLIYASCMKSTCACRKTLYVYLFAHVKEHMRSNASLSCVCESASDELSDWIPCTCCLYPCVHTYTHDYVGKHTAKTFVQDVFVQDKYWFVQSRLQCLTPTRHHSWMPTYRQAYILLYLFLKYWAFVTRVNKMMMSWLQTFVMHPHVLLTQNTHALLCVCVRVCVCPCVYACIHDIRRVLACMYKYYIHIYVYTCIKHWWSKSSWDAEGMYVCICTCVYVHAYIRVYFVLWRLLRSTRHRNVFCAGVWAGTAYVRMYVCISVHEYTFLWLCICICENAAYKQDRRV
jgi:hypothetical protein